MGILNPAAVPFIVLLGILILIYLRERWRARIDVPSLRFWREIKEDTVRTRRWLPDLLFFLQACLLLLLIGGLLHPYRAHTVTEKRGDRQILVFDISASMQAREGSTRRFEIALDEAKRVVWSLGPLDEVMLVSVATQPQLVSGFTTDRPLILHKLESLHPIDSGTNLTLGVELALAQRDRQGRHGTIHVFTDISKSSLRLPSEQVQNLVYHRVGTNDDNLALAAFSLHQNPFQQYAQAQAYMVVRNYAYRAKRAVLTVSLNETLLLRREFTLPAREATSFSVKGFTGPGRLLARLEPTDALEVDNQAWAWLAEQRERRLVVVSSAKALREELARVSQAIFGLTLTALMPEAFTPTVLNPQDIVLFHQFVPTGAVPANSLYVFPPLDNSLFPVLAEAAHLNILDWRDGHEILRNLRYVEALPFKTARVLALPSWAQVLISSRTPNGEVPLALAGEKDGHRVACLAFDLESGNLTNSDNLTLLLLFLNTLRWLLPQDPRAPLTTAAGEAFFLPPGVPEEEIFLSSPRGDKRLIENGSIDVEQVGEYHLDGEQYHAVLYANLFDDAESDIGRQEEADESQPLQVAASTPSEMTRIEPVEFGRLLYYGAAVLLALEWLYALWRYRRVSG